MNEKYLPIKIFEKRKDFDDRSTEGGGDKRIPAWVLSGDNLRERSQYLKKEIVEIKKFYDDWKTENKKLPFILSTTIGEEAIAKSYRGNLVNILESDGCDNVVGNASNFQILSVVSNDNVLINLEEAISNENNSTLISTVIDIGKYEPYVQEFEKEGLSYRVRLINYNDYDQNELVKRLFEKHCDNNNITINSKVRFTADMYIYRVTLDEVSNYEALKEFEGLYSAEITYPIMITTDGAEVTNTIPIKFPDKFEDYPTVGILDTGFSNIEHLKPWKNASEHINYLPEYQNNMHGTFVAGIVEYGDELNDFSTTSLKGVNLFNAVVYPNYNIYPEELIENIREAIEKNSEIKIWNLSLGTRVECLEDEFSEFGMALDNIQDENNVLIVKSAGNCENFKLGKSKGKVSQSADSIRSLVVGSIAQAKGLYDYVDINMPSPFTRIGPGPASIIKPDLVFYGGNAGMHNEKMVMSGVKSFATNDSIWSNIGTSFSTPVVTRIVSELAYMLNEEFDPLMLRALMIHYAKYPDSIKMKMIDKVNQMGFGMPVSANEILYNSPNEITLILRDTLEKGSFIEMFDFPYPESLIDENGFFRGQIILTLVNKSLVDDKQAGEYCQSNIDVYFGTYESEKDRDITKSTIKNPKGVSENQNLLSDSLYSARAKGIRTSTGFERECTLVKYGKKFHPVKKYAIDLADMTPSNKEKWLPSNRKWYLKIEGLFRDFIERDAIKNNYDLSQEYCMILTIRDPKNEAQVYNEVSQQLTAKNFIHHDVRVRNTISIDV